jgi:hypothetical protein
MTIRLLLLALLLLAACSEPRSSDGTPPARVGKAPDAALTPARPAGTATADLPDVGDPRLFVSMDSLRWSQWETRVDGDRLARLRALGITLIRSDSTGPREPVDASGMGDYDPYGENLRHFHLFDFTGDGVDDVVYSGPWYERGPNGFGAMEGTRFKLYQVMNGRAVEVMQHYGSLQRIFRGGAGQPVSFRTVQYGCCSDPEWSIQYYRPVRAGDTVRYEAHGRVMGREGLEMPAAFMSSPRSFTVNNARYLLRADPGIDTPPQDDADWDEWAGRGNALAEYGRGARGIALAERTDATGRVWWFVRMDGRTPPVDAQFPEANSEGIRMDRLGWMSSRFLTVEP